MRPRIKIIKSEKMSSSNQRTRNQLQRAHVLGIDRPTINRKDSQYLPGELPLIIKGGLIFDI